MNLSAADDAPTTHASQRWVGLLFAVAVFRQCIPAVSDSAADQQSHSAVVRWHTPSVWTTCMLFFQVLLCGGYLYSHLMTVTT
jgi:hypothetical protein